MEYANTTQSRHNIDIHDGTLYKTYIWSSSLKWRRNGMQHVIGKVHAITVLYF